MYFQLDYKLLLRGRISKVDLPTQNVTNRDIAIVSGWIGTCLMPSTQRIIHRTLIIADPKLCTNLQADEFCVKNTPATTKVRIYFNLTQ